MKRILLSVIIFNAVVFAEAQTFVSKEANHYGAAKWKTWLLDKPDEITVGAPPNAASSKAELQTLKQAISTIDEKGLAEIHYWNAGAPSYRWNGIIAQLSMQNFEVQLRMPSAWMNIAIYDATVLAWKEKLKYKRARPHLLDAAVKTIIDAPQTYAYPCEHSVTAAAAATVLAYFFPKKADSILSLGRAAAQSRVNAGVQYPSDIAAGWRLGEEVAKQIIEKAKMDGSATKWNGEMNKDPKKWTGAYPLGITLASFTPLVIKSPNQFRPSAPPDFENDMQELKNFKRTAKSNYIAYYWANTGNVWSELAALKMFEYRIHEDAPKAARIYAVLSTAYHDVAIAIMDAKYTYWGIRPNQYDTTYKPFIMTPPFPGYPSGHAAGAATSSAILGYFFPADAEQFRQLAQECADSRFYAGIHFRSDNEVGLRLGNEVGKYVVETWMK